MIFGTRNTVKMLQHSFMDKVLLKTKALRGVGTGHPKIKSFLRNKVKLGRFFVGEYVF